MKKCNRCGVGWSLFAWRIRLSFVSLLVLASCLLTKVAQAESLQEGGELYKTHCALCHTLSQPPKAAPPFRGIIRHYYERYDKRESFIDAISAFVHNPSDSEIICVPAKERFGKMPKLPVTEKQVGIIASWMWDNKSLWPPRFR